MVIYQGVAAHFKCPVIMLSTMRPTIYFNAIVGNPTEVSYVPNLMLGYKDPMDFMQRVTNFIMTFAEFTMRSYAMLAYSDFYTRNFPPQHYPSLDEMRKNVSLVLVNSHFSQGNPRPYVPAMIEVGGLHIKSKRSPLPDDIKNWLDSNPHGAILFSLGTNLNSSDIPPIKLNALVKAFSKLKQNILWKFENSSLSGLPRNVKISKWLPQDDILAHPNVKLFISHGGLSSVMEAKYHGVPIVGIAIYGDQMANLDVLRQDGCAEYINYSDLNERSFSQALNLVLSNSSYSENVKKWSELYRDRPASAMETAIYWVEYVLRHRGARHLQTNGVHLNFLQLHSVDVIGFLLILLLIYLMLFICFVKCCFSSCCFKIRLNDIKKKIA